MADLIDPIIEENPRFRYVTKADPPGTIGVCRATGLVQQSRQPRK